MTNQALHTEPVPLKIIQPLLQEHLDDSTAVITAFDTELMTHVGCGGNLLWRANIAWHSGDKATSTNWIIKHWRPGGPLGDMMGVTQPAEALAWLHGVNQAQSLPEGMVAPYVGVHLDEAKNGAWIVMDDIAPALSSFQASESLSLKIQKLKFILDRLAQFHVYWERPERLEQLKEQDYFLSQERYLWAGTNENAISLGLKASDLAIPLDEAPLTKYWRKGLCDFLAWLPDTDLELWQTHLCDRQALVAAFSKLPQTLIHGDLAWNNIGLQWEKGQKSLLPIDWELAGICSPAMDVARFVALTLDLKGDLYAATATLPDFYFDRYLAHGGTQLDAESWQQSYDLATVFINLWQFPFWAGLTVGEDPTTPEDMVRDAEMIRYKTNQTTNLMRRWLN